MYSVDYAGWADKIEGDVFDTHDGCMKLSDTSLLVSLQEGLLPGTQHFAMPRGRLHQP